MSAGRSQQQDGQSQAKRHKPENSAHRGKLRSGSVAEAALADGFHWQEAGAKTGASLEVSSIDDGWVAADSLSGYEASLSQSLVEYDDTESNPRLSPKESLKEIADEGNSPSSSQATEPLEPLNDLLDDASPLVHQSDPVSKAISMGDAPAGSSSSSSPSASAVKSPLKRGRDRARLDFFTLPGSASNQSERSLPASSSSAYARGSSRHSATAMFGSGAASSPSAKSHVSTAQLGRSSSSSSFAGPAAKK